jgi:hypothetical protein
MAFEYEVRRYAAYYAGWCVAFGEHKMAYDEGRDVSWLFGDSKVGIAVPPRLKRALDRELLGGSHQDLPQITLADAYVMVNERRFEFDSRRDGIYVERLKAFFLGSNELHMFLTSHFCYPPGTRIITFARKKPLPIMYKEIDPLKLMLA